MQYCHRLLVGDLLSVALYPHTEDTGRAAREATWAISSPEEARSRGDAMIARYSMNTSWQNVTTTRTTELLHRPSGYRCQFDWDPSASVFGTPDWEAASLSGNCYMNRGRIQTRTIIRRELPGKGLRYTMMDAPPQHLNQAWTDRPSRYRISNARVGGMRVSRAVLPDFARGDARQETCTIVLGAVIRGWVVVQSTTGPVADTARIEEVAARELQKVLTSQSH